MLGSIKNFYLLVGDASCIQATGTHFIKSQNCYFNDFICNDGADYISIIIYKNLPFFGYKLLNISKKYFKMLLLEYKS